MEKNDPGKSFAFTLNNWKEPEYKQLIDLEKNYMIIGKEKGVEKTPHLQGVIIFKIAKRPTALKKLNPRIHWEHTKEAEAAINYCTKELEYEIQDFRSQGNRSDLKNATETTIKYGLRETALQYPETFVKYHAGLSKLKNVVTEVPRRFKPEVIWIHGPTGVGKSRYVFDKEPNLWVSGKNLKWWDGYEGQEATLFDDFRGDFCTFHELLRILDRYPYRVEFKGGSTELRSLRMYITSCHSPEEVYNTREDIKQLLRRIDIIKIMK